MKHNPQGQSKSGPQFKSGGNSGKTSGGSVPSGQSKPGTPFSRGSRGSTAGNSNGVLEGQHLRGYVHDAKRSGLPAPQDASAGRVKRSS
jgi:hypothetical protein